MRHAFQMIEPACRRAPLVCTWEHSRARCKAPKATEPSHKGCALCVYVCVCRADNLVCPGQASRGREPRPGPGQGHPCLRGPHHTFQGCRSEGHITHLSHTHHTLITHNTTCSKRPIHPTESGPTSVVPMRACNACLPPYLPWPPIRTFCRA